MNSEKVNVLAIAAHPDDAELSCSGTLMKHIANGDKVAIVDLTRGELGTRGSAELRDKEASAASEIMGISYRENLGMADGFFEVNRSHILPLITQIRRFQPDIILANAVSDRHPDHGRGAKLTTEACFYAGLIKIKTEYRGASQAAWRPKAVYHYIQDRYIHPDFVVDITPFWERKVEAIMAFGSQFYNPESKEPISPIATKDFKDFLEGRARQFGREANCTFGEGFTVERVPQLDLLTDLA